MNPRILEVHLDNHPRSGKTTLAVAMVKGMIEMGHSAVIVLPTDDFARDAARRHCLPASICMGFHRFARNPELWNLIVLDGHFHMQDYDGISPVETARRRMDTLLVGQLVLIP